jgi:hypothetical protein
MQTRADVPPPPVERVGEPQCRQAVARSVQDRCDGREIDKREPRPDAYQPYDHRGLVVVASAWLAFYVVAAATALQPLAIEIEAHQ